MLNSSARVTHEKEAAGAPCCGSVSKRFLLGFVCLVLVSGAVGCASSKGAGLYVALSLDEKRKVLEELKKNWQDYDIYCDGPIGAPGALIFDPKDDDRHLVGYRYVKLLKEDSVMTAIVWIQFQGNYDPSLYKIFDEEKNFYGYVLIAGDLPVPKRLDEKTLELPSFQSKFFFALSVTGTSNREPDSPDRILLQG
jgi:hypothetical protein